MFAIFSSINDSMLTLPLPLFKKASNSRSFLLCSQARIPGIENLSDVVALYKLRTVLATALLLKNFDDTKASLEVLIADIQFLRHQVTITQVTFARVFNRDVHQRRIQQTEAAVVKDS